MFEVISIIVLILLGLGLILVELIFVPGTTFVGIVGFVLTGIGIYLVFDTYGATAGYATILGSALVSAIGIVYSFRSNAWDRFSLKSAIRSKVNEDDVYTFQVGERGKAISDIKPVGKAEIFGKLYEVRSKGEYISNGQAIQVVKIDQKRIFVEPI